MPGYMLFIYLNYLGNLYPNFLSPVVPISHFQFDLYYFSQRYIFVILIFYYNL